MYKAIILDLGKVLIHFDFKRGYSALEQLCPYPAAEIRRRISATGLVPQFETGLIESHLFVEQLRQCLDLKLDYARFCEIWSSIFAETLVPEELLERLAGRYRLVLLSNTNVIHFEMVRNAYPLLRHFHAFVLSYEVKAMKPAEAIFRAAVEAAECRPEECFYADDIAEFIEGAKRFGIDAVQFESAEQLERELAARGIV